MFVHDSLKFSVVCFRASPQLPPWFLISMFTTVLGEGALRQLPDGSHNNLDCFIELYIALLHHLLLYHDVGYMYMYIQEDLKRHIL